MRETPDRLLHLLRFAAQVQWKALPANISGPLVRAGLIRHWHAGWGVYEYDITPAGRELLANSDPS